VNLDIITVFLYSYLLGSIPFGLILTKTFLKKDVRKIGSGNIGATNVLRAGNKFLAAITLILDLMKGYISVFITIFLFYDLIFLSGLACLLGHIFPFWLKFKGGKGIATYLGIILSLSYEYALIFIICWLIILSIFRYSSLSSIVSSFAVLMFSIIFDDLNINIFLFIVFIIFIYTHKENIFRLINKSENKVKL